MKEKIIALAKGSLEYLPAVFGVVFFSFLIIYSGGFKTKIATAPEVAQQIEASDPQTINNENQLGETAGVETSSENGSNEENSEQAAEVAEETETANTQEESETEEAEEEPPRPSLLLGVVSDAHSSQIKGFGQLGSFAWAMKNVYYPDAVIDVGDLIESRADGKYLSKNEAEADYKKARYIISAFPQYNVIGNHEVLSMSKDNIKSISGRNNYFSANVKGYNIIILDTNYTESEKHIDAKHEDDFIYDGTINDKQLDWLKSELKSKQRNIIFSHHPLYELTNEDDVEDIVKKYKASVIFIANGHQHSWSTRTFGGVTLYNLPSLYYNRMYTVAKIYGNTAYVTPRKY